MKDLTKDLALLKFGLRGEALAEIVLQRVKEGSFTLPICYLWKEELNYLNKDIYKFVNEHYDEITAEDSKEIIKLENNINRLINSIDRLSTKKLGLFNPQELMELILSMRIKEDMRKN